MSYLKTFNSTDIIVTPFTVHKQFSFTPDFFIGQINQSYPLNGEETSTGSLSLSYNSIKHLYYSNYLSGSDGLTSNASTASFNLDGTITGPFYTTNYINSLPNTSGSLRYFPTQGNQYIGIISLPSKYYGDYIQPGSVTVDITSTGTNQILTGEYIDDSEGNLVFKTNPLYHGGNIIYEEGILIFTGTSSLGIPNVFAANNIAFNSSYTIYETQYKCTIRANEYNYSLNPSLLQSSSIELYKDFITGSDFSPYITTVGLYNDNQELLAVAKLAQPLPTSQTTDTIILINLDR